MAQAINRRYLIADPRVRSRVGPCRNFGGQIAIGTGFLLVFQLYPLIFIPPLLLTVSFIHRRRNSYNVLTFDSVLITEFNASCRTSSTATGSGSNVSGGVWLPKGTTLKGITLICSSVVNKQFL